MNELQGELDRLERMLVETIALSTPQNKVGNLAVNINAGGAAIWIAVTCCLVMLACLVVAVPVGVGAYLATQAEVKQLQNTDNAIRAYINTGKMPPAPEKK